MINRSKSKDVLSWWRKHITHFSCSFLDPFFYYLKLTKIDKTKLLGIHLIQLCELEFLMIHEQSESIPLIN